MKNTDLINKQGIVTGTVRPNSFGEVVLPVGNRTEFFFATPYDNEEEIAVGHAIVVVAISPNYDRTVLVTAMPENPITETL